MTHSHQLDLALVYGALAGDRFPYVGLIGSKSKRARFEKRLAAAGIPATRIGDLVCPIGIAGDRHRSCRRRSRRPPSPQLVMRDEALRLSSADSAAAEPRLRGGRAG